MQNRINDGTRARRQTARGILITTLVFAVLIVVLCTGLARVNTRSDREQAAALREAVMRATVLCYAVEGRYPSGVEELREHYGLTYNDDRFIVRLDAFSSNLLPDIRVLSVGGEAYD